jgi:phosphohistidine phosphatase
MELYVLRHGRAEAALSKGSDADRKLTENGRRELRGVLEKARAAGAAPSMILTSPYLRAVKTAELAAEILGYRGEIVTTETLIPETEPERVWEEIRARKNEPAILLAGHQPLMGHLVEHLTDSRIEMPPGTLVRIDLEEFTGHPGGKLVWTLTP